MQLLPCSKKSILLGLFITLCLNTSIQADPFPIDPTELFKRTFLTTVVNLEYSQDVIQKCPFTYLPLVFSSLIPEISAFFARHFSSLYSTRMSTFCTEGVALAFQEAGILKNEKYTNIRGPISWMHGMVPEFTLLWGKEIQLV